MEDHSEKIYSIACPSCDEGNESENQFCVHCGNPLPRSKGTPLKKRHILLGIIGLALVAGIGLFGTGILRSKLVGKVNGEEITKKEFSKRLERAKKFYELRYGQNLFQGEEGKGNLNRLKTEVLDEITTEKILLQEAKSAGYGAASEDEIQKEVDAVKKKYGLSDDDLKQKMGGSITDLKEELRKGWIISQFVEKAVLKGDQQNAQLVFAQWFAKAKARAKIETYEKLESVSTVKASCCRSGCGGGRAQPLDPKIEADAKAKGLEYYEKKTQKKGASARVTNFGCHIQVDIVEDGKVVISLTYRQGEVQEI